MHNSLELHCNDSEWLLREGAFRSKKLTLVRNDLVIIHVKGPTGQDWSDVAEGLFILKSASQYSGGGDFTVACKGFEDDAFHDPDKTRISIAVGIPLETPLADYYGAVILYDAVGNTRTCGNGTFTSSILHEPVTGSETNIPDGLTPVGFTSRVTGVATISGSNIGVVISLPGMTSTGLVTMTPLVSTGGFANAQIVYPGQDYLGSPLPVDEFAFLAPSSPELSTGDGKTFRFQWWLRWKE